MTMTTMIMTMIMDDNGCWVNNIDGYHSTHVGYEIGTPRDNG